MIVQNLKFLVGLFLLISHSIGLNNENPFFISYIADWTKKSYLYNTSRNSYFDNSSK